MPTHPCESRKATSFAQQHQPHGIAVRLQLGGERRGIQYCRMNSPMTVPGPTRVRSVLSCAFMNALAAVHAAMDGEGPGDFRASALIVGADAAPRDSKRAGDIQ
jgi:hypothetical protein